MANASWDVYRSSYAESTLVPALLFASLFQQTAMRGLWFVCGARVLARAVLVPRHGSRSSLQCMQNLSGRTANQNWEERREGFGFSPGYHA